MLSVGPDAHHRFWAVCILDAHGVVVKRASFRALGGVGGVASIAG